MSHERVQIHFERAVGEKFTLSVIFSNEIPLPAVKQVTRVTRAFLRSIEDDIIDFIQAHLNDVIGTKTSTLEYIRATASLEADFQQAYVAYVDTLKPSKASYVYAKLLNIYHLVKFSSLIQGFDFEEATCLKLLRQPSFINFIFKWKENEIQRIYSENNDLFKFHETTYPTIAALQPEYNGRIY